MSEKFSRGTKTTYKQTNNSFIQGCFVPGLVEICGPGQKGQNVKSLIVTTMTTMTMSSGQTSRSLEPSTKV